LKSLATKSALIIAAALLLTSCASTNNTGRSAKNESAAPVEASGPSEKSKVSDNFRKSSICKGKINAQRGVMEALSMLKGEPIGFACNASYHYAKALAMTHKAVGNVEAELRAIRFAEGMQNGAVDPSGIGAVATTNMTADQRAKEKEEFAADKQGERKKMLTQASAARQAALKQLAMGSIAVLSSIKQTEQGLKSKDGLGKVLAVVKIAELAMAAQVIPSIVDTEKKMRANLSHLDVIATADSVDLDSVATKPD
jgi:hypothetical protein